MKIKYILPVLLALLSVACFDDDTTVDTVEISVISIDTTKLQKVYNIDKLETCLIEPVIVQTNSSLPLTYEWQIDYKVYSDSSVFKFDGNDLGSHIVRLKVSNRDGSAFYSFKLNVNSPYEEGITILSEDSEGNMLLSFMRKYTEEELAKGVKEEFLTNCLQGNNPDVVFEKSPSDMAKRGKQLFISCKNKPIIYALNTKTFELENAISAPEYPDFVPIKMNIPDDENRSAITLCENGLVYDLSTFEGLILPHAMLTGQYAEQTFFCVPYNTYSYLWDSIAGQVLDFNGYQVLTSEDIFYNHELIHFFNGVYNDYITVITRDKTSGEYWKTSIGVDFLAYNDDYSEFWLDVREEKKLSGNIPLTSNTISVASSIYRQLLYAEGNKIYRWYYSDNNFPTNPWATIDLNGGEITSLSLSPDETQVYVGVYQPNESGMNGHLYILDTDTGKQVSGSPWHNIAYKPVEVMYKVK